MTYIGSSNIPIKAPTRGYHWGDLHVHSNFSDGSSSVPVMIDHGYRFSELEAIAFAEHVSSDPFGPIKAYQAAKEHIQKNGLSMVAYPAAEVNVYVPRAHFRHPLHCLVYGESEELNRLLVHLKKSGQTFIANYFDVRNYGLVTVMAHPNRQMLETKHLWQNFDGIEYYVTMDGQIEAYQAMKKHKPIILSNSDAHSKSQMGNHTDFRALPERVDDLLNPSNIKGLEFIRRTQPKRKEKELRIGI